MVMKYFTAAALLLALTSSPSEGFHLKKKLAAAAALASASAPVVLGDEVAEEVAVAEPIYYKQTVQLPTYSFVQPSVAYLGVRESIPSAPAFKAGVLASLETTKNGVVNIATYAKNAVVNSAKALFNVKAAIGNAVVLPFSAAASGLFSAAKTYNNYRFATPIYKYVPAQAVVQSDVVVPRVVVSDSSSSIKEAIVGPSGYVVRYGENH